MSRTRHAARFAARLAALLLAGALLGSVPTAAAQADDDAQRRGEQVREMLLERARAKELNRNTQLVSLSFPGGTLDECIAALKLATEEESANIIVRGEAGAIPVGPVELRDVPLVNVLRLLSGDYQVGPSRYIVSMQEFSGNPGQPLAYSIEVQALGSARPFAVSATKILVLSLKEITTALPGDPPEAVVPAETILTAVETALAVAEGETADARVQYHAESGLLVMAGNQQALETANQVIEAIARDVRTRRDRARDLQQSQNLTNPDLLEERLADARVAAEMAEVQMGRARTHMEITQQQIVEVEKRVKEGMASTNELREFHMRLSDTQAEMLERQIMVKRSKQSVEHAEVKLERALRLVAGTGNPFDRTEALGKENEMLRERLAMLETQLATLSARLESGNGGRGGRR